jgi:hypothetical protein
VNESSLFSIFCWRWFVAFFLGFFNTFFLWHFSNMVFVSILFGYIWVLGHWHRKSDLVKRKAFLREKQSERH